MLHTLLVVNSIINERRSNYPARNRRFHPIDSTTGSRLELQNVGRRNTKSLFELKKKKKEKEKGKVNGTRRVWDAFLFVTLYQFVLFDWSIEGPPFDCNDRLFPASKYPTKLRSTFSHFYRSSNARIIRVLSRHYLERNSPQLQVEWLWLAMLAELWLPIRKSFTPIFLSPE